MYRKILKITVFVLALCTSFVGFAQIQGVVDYSVSAKHQDFKVCFTRLDKKFKPKFKGKYIQTTDFKQIANQPQFLVEKKKIAKLLETKAGKAKYDLANTYNKLVEMSKKKKLDIDVGYVIIGDPSLLKTKDKQYFTYKTTAALTVEVKAKGKDSTSTSNAKNELTLLWTVEMDNQKEKSTIKSIQLTSLNAKTISGFFEYEKQKMQKIVENLIEKYYQNLLSREWDIVLKPEIPNKQEIENHLKNSARIEKDGNIATLLPNSQTIIVGQGSVPSINIYGTENGIEDFTDDFTEDVTEKPQRFALSFNIKINDSLTGGEITKVTYYHQLGALGQPVISEPKPKKEVQQPEMEERGITYKVQILALYSFVELADLPKEYSNIKNILIEESIIGNRTCYQYVIPVGNNMNDAQALKNKLIEQGLNDVWVVTYKDGKRIDSNKK